MTRFAFDIPTLETERLALRAPREADLDALAAMMAEERTRHIGGPMDRFQSWRRLASDIGHWAWQGFGYWSIERREDGAWIGMVGLYHPSHFPEPELGWGAAPAFEGRGYMREAAEAARRWGYETQGWRTLISLIDPQNHRSRALATRLGARIDGGFTHADGWFCDVWRHPGPEALAA
ncbi:MAG: GNAT family N-acetyltransferase [Pseudomonadota bacterium]